MVNADARQPGLHSSMAGRIRAAMATHRVTMKGLSKEAGIPYGTLQGYLLERHPLPAEPLGKIAAILDVLADRLPSGQPARRETPCTGPALILIDENSAGAHRKGKTISNHTSGK